MNRIPLVSFEKEFELLKDSYIESFKHQLEISQFIGGSSVINFEKKIDDYFNVKHVIGVGNGTDALLIALESIRDPGNLGTITRTCEWFGVKQIVCSKDSVDLYNPKVVQASMGSSSRININYYQAK